MWRDFTHLLGTTGRAVLQHACKVGHPVLDIKCPTPTCMLQGLAGEATKGRLLGSIETGSTQQCSPIHL
jgi:hypothetical protein